MFGKIKELALPFVILMKRKIKKEALTQKEKRAQEKYLAALKPGQRKTKKSVIVGMAGLIGSGKSSVAKALASLIGATVIEGDEIRILLRKEGERYEGARKIAENAITEIIRKGGNVIVDADHIDPKKRASLKVLAKRIGATMIFMRTYVNGDVKGIPGTNFDIMIGRIMTANYSNRPEDFFGGAKTSWKGNEQERGAVVKLREMWRRTPQHYEWVNQVGGRWVLKKLPFPVFALVDTTDENEWPEKVEKIAKQILAV